MYNNYFVLYIYTSTTSIYSNLIFWEDYVFEVFYSYIISIGFVKYFFDYYGNNFYISFFYNYSVEIISMISESLLP